MTDETETPAEVPADDGLPEKNESNDSGGSLSPAPVEEIPTPDIGAPVPSEPDSAPEIAVEVIEASEGEHIPFVPSPDRHSQAPEVAVDAEGKPYMTGRMLFFDKAGNQVS